MSTRLATGKRPAACVKSRALLAIAAAALAFSGLAAAQSGEPVTMPGYAIPGWGQVKEVQGLFARAAGSGARMPAVLILHGSAGVDGRGAFYAKALQEAGIATLEITMFQRGGRPRAGHPATLPFAAAALKWLATQPHIDPERIGVMGFSWGGVMSVLLSSELVHEQIAKDVPRPAAFAPLYPVCSAMGRFLSRPQNPLFGAHTRMSATPMLIQVGTRDDYEQSERACDAFLSAWPQAARERTTVRYIEGATHGFDSQTGSRRFFDEFAGGGRGGMVEVVASAKDAAEARAAVVAFFAKNLVAQRDR
jgi:dienelactone hydrolase